MTETNIYWAIRTLSKDHMKVDWRHGNAVLISSITFLNKVFRRNCRCWRYLVFQVETKDKLGCGSGLPTALVFAHALKTTRAAQFVLQDYNDIFALSTVPNLFLTWYVTKHGTQEDLNEIEVTQDLKQNFVTDLKTLDIDFQFLVGSWGTSLIVRFFNCFD